MDSFTVVRWEYVAEFDEVLNDFRNRATLARATSTSVLSKYPTYLVLGT